MSDKISYNIKEAAKAIGISRATLYRSIKAGEIETSHLGRVVIERAEIERALARRRGVRQGERRA